MYTPYDWSKMIVTSFWRRKITGDACIIPLDLSYGEISPGEFIQLYTRQIKNCIRLIVSSRQAVPGISIRCFERQSFVCMTVRNICSGNHDGSKVLLAMRLHSRCLFFVSILSSLIYKD